MRDVLVTLIIAGALPFALRLPHIGGLVWAWISYMNPHRLGWGFAYNLPFAQVTAIVTLLGLFFSAKEPRPKIHISPLIVLWGVYLLWMSITTITAFDQSYSIEQLIKVLKIQFMAVLTLILFTTKERVIQLIWVIALSLGFFGFKGGVFTILQGGGERVFGPAESFIADNNHLALALLMTIPLLIFLRGQLKNKWARMIMLVGIGLVAISIVGSYSRGALVASFAVAVFLWLKGRNKVSIAFVSVIVFTALFQFMPQSWHERMGTISGYDEDESVQGRFEAWEVAYHVANDRVFGGGFDFWSQPVFDAYSPGYVYRAAHSIYFAVLGEHGWIGLILFVSILLLAWRTASFIIRKSREHEELRWAEDLARMIQVSFIAYMSGGTFLSLAYFDLPWHFIAILILIKSMVIEHIDGITHKGEHQGKALRRNSNLKPYNRLQVGSRRLGGE